MRILWFYSISTSKIVLADILWYFSQVQNDFHVCVGFFFVLFVCLFFSPSVFWFGLFGLVGFVCLCSMPVRNSHSIVCGY